MSVVLVGGIVQIDDVGRRGPQDGGQIRHDIGAARILHHRAGMRELEHGPIVAQPGRAALFRPAGGFHLFVAKLGKPARARTPAAIGDDHTREGAPGVGCADAVIGENLDVVLVRRRQRCVVRASAAANGRRFGTYASAAGEDNFIMGASS
jgi:hypothetical protein